jgi:hypothetical protein
MASSDAAQFKVRSTAGGESRPGIFDRMEAGREWLRFLIAQLRQSRDSAPDRRRLFDMLCDAVEAHGAAAEQSLYAEFLARAEEENKWPARYAVGVHDMSELLIFELSNLDMAGEAWQADFGQLAEYLEDHFRVEAGEIFQLAKTLCDDEQAVRLGDKYERTRRQWIEVFGRLPAAPQPLPAERSHPVDPAGGDAGLRGRGRAATWFERLRRPLRTAGPSRSATAG